MRLSTLLFCTALVVNAQVANAQNLILVNGKILTVDPADSVAQAVAIAAGKIVAVGSDEAVRKAAVPGSSVIDLHGRSATPGLIDSHCHFQSVQELYGLSLGDSSITHIDDILQSVRAAVAKAKAGEWIRGKRLGRG